jgi:TRAP-type C4-dicarboxylate transport system substrate-binding protein
MLLRTRRNVVATAVLSLFLGAAPAAAQDKPVTLRYASNAPPTSPWANQINRFAKDVDEESKGTVKIEPFFGGQLGNEQDTIQQVARGRIDMGGFASGAVALLVPEFALPALPFYFSSVEEADCVLDKHLAKPMGDLLAAKGVMLLGFAEVGEINFAGKRPFVVPKDVAGTKMVSYNKINSIMWTALGANSSFIGVPDWSSALQTGLVDAVGTPMALYVPSGLNKVAPVLSRTQAWNSPSGTLINKGIFDKMSKAQQDALMRAVAKVPVETMRSEIRGVEGALRAAHVKGGGQLVELSREQREEWRKALAGAWPEMVKSMGGDGDRLFKVVEAGRAACAKK